jgi:hypothetical protein
MRTAKDRDEQPPIDSKDVLMSDQAEEGAVIAAMISFALLMEAVGQSVRPTSNVSTTPVVDRRSS